MRILSADSQLNGDVGSIAEAECQGQHWILHSAQGCRVCGHNRHPRIRDAAPGTKGDGECGGKAHGRRLSGIGSQDSPGPGARRQSNPAPSGSSTTGC